MIETYRIKKGNLTSEDKVIPFDFGLIFEEDGFFFFDFYINDSFDLNSFIENDKAFSNEYSMTALTDNNNQIEATSLSMRNITPHKSFIRMQSYGNIKHAEARRKYGSDDLINEDIEKRKIIYYLELEGLKMEHTDLTETIRARRGVEIKDYNNFERDHTTALLIYNSPISKGCNNFHFTFFQSETEGNISVELINDEVGGPNVLYFDIYNEFKRDLLFLLSLLNGAEVAVRKEYIGGFYRIGSVASQTVITYSFRKIKNKSFNDYIPLNSGLHKANLILGNVFMSCFDKYVEENKKLDLNSIIYYLNSVEQSRSIEERFFVLIIAFERLAKKYIETLNNEDFLLLSEDEYKPIKEQLIETLNKHITPENKSTINTIANKIGGLNKRRKGSTEYKFLKLLEYAGIILTPEIENIIQEVRHKTVHQGDIGVGNQAIKNFLVLDELIRDIILNIIGYKNARISKYRLKESTNP